MTCDETKACGYCRAPLKADEIEFYGASCERCESEIHHAFQEGREPVLPPPSEADYKARTAQAEAEVARLTAALADANAAREVHASAALDAEHWNERAVAAEASASALQERVATLEAALRPFATYAADMPGADSGEGEIGEYYHEGFRRSIRTQDLRAALCAQPERGAGEMRDLPRSDFRQGRKVARNVYHGDEPLFMAATDEMAGELVKVLNAGAAALRAQTERGAEEMRERAASVCERDSRQFFEHMLRHAADDEHEAAIHFTTAAMAASNLAKSIRALPLHPDKEGGGR